MKNLLTIIGFIVVAIAFYVLWGNLSARIVAIESDTGSYIYTETGDTDDSPAATPAADVEALRRQLAALEAAQRENTSAIDALAQRLDRFEAAICRGEDCGRRVVGREVVFFDLDNSELSGQAKDRIDRLLDAVGDGALISLRGQADAVGEETYNYMLSLRRAAAVKRYIDGKLNAANQPDKLLVTIDGTGEVLAAGAEGVEDPQSRVVEILVFE